MGNLKSLPYREMKIFATMLAAALPLMAMGNRPDSLMLFSYANPNGEGGLKLAWSADGEHWTKLNSGNSVINSDFGPWGSMKKMYEPKLTQAADGMWVATWKLKPDNNATAMALSEDLIHWGAQTYAQGEQKYEPKPGHASAVSTLTPAKAKVGSKEYVGWVNMVPASTVETLEAWGDARARHNELYDQTMSEDSRRFADLTPLKGKLTVYPEQRKRISDKLMGIFFEDINYSADGGLYAELVRNRDFEFTPRDHRGWGPATAWSLRNADGDSVTLTIATENPIHANNPHYVTLQGGDCLTNEGFDGIPVKKGEKYFVSLFGRAVKGGANRAIVQLIDPQGNIIGKADLKFGKKGWKKAETTLTASQSCKDATLRVSVPEGATADLDMISLMPEKTFKGRRNGLREDLAQTLADLNPKFVRFPGGCVAHGDGIDNIYDWKGSIGPLEARKPLSNLWGYHQTRGLGYHEYFLFCEDIGAQPLPVVAAGVPCQNSGKSWHGAHDLVTSCGQQGGIPMDSLDSYIQDVLDLIEYANGDAKTTRWGRERAKAGHPAPFNLKMIGIGNEDMITEVFAERFKAINKAVTAKYPDIKVVGTVGPFYEGTDYDLGWQLATEEGLPLVDEHYYVKPGWLIHNQHYYDYYDRKKPHVYLGEWAAHLDGRPSNIETALAEALWLTAVERNADVVEIASYAPLLAKEKHTQWRPDLIYFNNSEVKPTVDYYIQQLYGENPGAEYVSSELKLDGGQRADVTRRVAVSVTLSPEGKEIVKIANLLPVEVTLELEGVDGGKEFTRTEISGKPADTDSKPVEKHAWTSGQQITLPAYSFTLLREN